MAKDRQKRDQKRKAKQAKKKQKARQAKSQSVSLAYMGNKYRTNELVPIWMETEIGIYETFVMTEQKLVDRTVKTAVESLIKQMRSGTLPPLSDTIGFSCQVGHEHELVIENIRRRWQDYFENEMRPSKDKMIGVLRTILGSIETMRSASANSQNYLHHITEFLTKQLGVSVTQLPAHMQPPTEPTEDGLVLLGRKWLLDGNQEAKAEFFELASDCLSEGRATRVIDACQQLQSEASDPESEAVAALAELSNQARQSLNLTTS